ncbi:MAG TPA: hypothetical protein VEA99_15010 [Gemmatimonadaceae bacterium]|nr:hypothetical protein [Gemmatimonadaceae bacterium]
MTCAECRERLAEVALPPPRAGLDDGIDAPLREHLAACPRCATIAERLADAERALAASLAASRPTLSAATVAEHAWAAARRRRRLQWLGAVAVAGAGALAWVVAARLGPELRRLTAPPPPVVVETFTVTCLAPEQAAALVRPHLPPPENPRWQVERFGVEPVGGGIRAITVRAPRAVIDRVPALLARFETHPDAACRRAPPAGVPHR